MLKICPTCNANLLDTGEIPYIMFVRILKKYLEYDQPVLIAYSSLDGLNTVLRFLEQMRYIKTTEGPSGDTVEMIYCIPTTLQRNDEHSYYCAHWGDDSHFINNKAQLFDFEDDLDEY